MPGEENLERVGEMLIEEGIVTYEEISDSLQAAGRSSGPLGRALLRGNPVRRRELAAFLAMDVEIPNADLGAIELSPAAAALIPESVARRHACAPVDQFGGILCVVAAEIPDRAAVGEMRRLTGLKIKVLRAGEEQVLAAIDKLYGGGVPARADLTLSLTGVENPAATESVRGEAAAPASAAVWAIAVDPEPASAAADPVEVRRVVEAWERVFVSGHPIPAEKVA